MARSGTRRKRVVGVVVLAVIAVVVGIATTVVAAVAAPERITALWVSATVADDGSAQVEEVIDYDFGGHQRHGIFRDVPGLRTSAPIEVSSPDAPDSFTLTGSFPPQIKIGDPDETVSGQHRYVLRYTVDGVAPGGAFAWDAVGTGWQVDIEDVEVHVVAPTSLSGQRCVAGTTGSTDRCAIDQPEPGHLVAHVDRVPSGEGVTVYATAGEPLATAPAQPSPPSQAAAAPPTGTSPAVPGLLAGVLALLVGLLTVRVLRQAGRERVPATGIPSLGAPGEEARIDFEELGGYATPTPTLPAGLSAAQGGVLLADAVRNEHKAAWLVEQAVAGTIELTGGEGWDAKDMALVRLAPGDAGAQRLLDTAFRGRQVVVLGRYDQDFAGMWKQLGEELSGWRRASGLWDGAADSRTVLVRVLGTLVGLVGAGLAVLGGWLSAEQVTLPLVLAGVGGVLVGAGFAGLVRGWELKVLTPAGSATWLQAESLRQFLEQSPPTAIDEAVGNGRLGIYTAWALALGQGKRWRELATTATVPGRRGYYSDPYYRYAAYSPVFVHSCSTAGTAPSSSSSGGGGGGVGGGAGGGGGGSW
ncbi:DUF2207 domain-containing protein [Petropleomorpha daqingensis]|uniref:TIGR04222 domain-containing protein n=1 Tax=Petropleomorpha daqingensis TaxID=2026353 RepID=A0A853CI71_9ACTN|nr:hypothetical protein [Petropleomorpha daqingensis]